VRPQDRCTSKEIVKYLQELVDCENRVQEPIDEIQAIFEKIHAWKAKAGDLDQQEKMVAVKLKPKEKLKVHNIKTIMALLGGLQRDIGLTDDDIRIIVFTSIDPDYFTNLLLL